VSEISITRFQPAVVTRGKVNSVEAVENDLEGNSERQDQQQRQDAQSEQPPEVKRPKQTTASGNRHVGEAAGSEVDEEILEQAVSRLNAYVQTVKRDLIFDIDPESQEPSVTVLDRESRQVLRQFNSKEALELAKKLESQEPISLFKTQV
jgi:flagellar protein FlaG